MENLEITINLPNLKINIPEDKINLHNLEKKSLRFNPKDRPRIIRRTIANNR
jgi:hypothetical protein